MAKSHIYILSGGIGSRFWPKSRQQFPKQFIDILGLGKSLLQLTAERFSKMASAEDIYYITHQDYKTLIQEQVPSTPSENILCEPSRRNTAPCIAYAAFKLYHQDPEGVMVIVPSDHLLLKEELYLHKIQEAIAYASDHPVLITLGIQPTRPDTGYGYIHYHPTSSSDSQNNIYKVNAFVEKPTAEKARAYLQSGDYLWNAGMFIWKAKDILDAFQQYSPEIFQLFEKGSKLYNTAEEKEFIDSIYSSAPNISIDYAILEKASNVVTLPADIGWSDLGTWNSLHDVYEYKDEEQNALIAKHVYIKDSENCMISASQGKLLVIKGLKDYIVVDDDDVLLIFPKSEEQGIKKIIEELKEKDGLEKFL